MKKIIILLIAVLFCFLLASCSDNSDNVSENASTEETITQEIDSNIQTEDSSLSMPTGSLNLEDVTSAYVEPAFKIVSTVAECYNYLEYDADDTVTTENNPDGSVALITVTDKDGNTKSTMKFTYNDKIVATATFYSADNSTEKVAFSFYDETTLNIIAHVNNESEMSLYLYNKDGSFNSYIDSAGFSSLLIGSVMEGFGGALSQ